MRDTLVLVPWELREAEQPVRRHLLPAVDLDHRRATVSKSATSRSHNIGQEQDRQPYRDLRLRHLLRF